MPVQVLLELTAFNDSNYTGISTGRDEYVKHIHELLHKADISAYMYKDKSGEYGKESLLQTIFLPSEADIEWLQEVLANDNRTLMWEILLCNKF